MTYTNSTPMRCTTLATPMGDMLAASRDGALTGLWFIGQRWFPKNADAWTTNDRDPLFDVLRAQLAEYFAGTRRAFDLPLAPGGGHGTPFQRAVWQAIAQVPFGTTITYTELAAAVGEPRAMRAAGAATGRNPLTLVIPCHRIVGRDGSLTGYAGGLDRKRALLAFERGESGLRFAQDETTAHVTSSHESMDEKALPGSPAAATWPAAAETRDRTVETDTADA